MRLAQGLEEVFAKIKSLEVDLEDLRATYQGVNKSYVAALSKLGELTLHASEAAKRAAKSTEQSRVAAKHAALAALQASASRMAADSAAEAVKLSNQARQTADLVRTQSPSKPT